MNRTGRLTVIATTAAIATALAACSSARHASVQHEESEAECRAVKPGTITTVNSMCAVVHEDPVNPAVEAAVWKGQSVGFCCKGCKPRWEKMTGAEKDAALAKAIAASKQAG